MAKIEKIFHKDANKASKYEPFAGLEYDGSYQAAEFLLKLIGMQNLDLSPNQAGMGFYDLIGNMMDDNSNLRLPRIMEDRDIDLIGSVPMTVRVGFWFVFEVKENGDAEAVVMPPAEFDQKYVVRP